MSEQDDRTRWDNIPSHGDRHKAAISIALALLSLALVLAWPSEARASGHWTTYIPVVGGPIALAHEIADGDVDAYTVALAAVDVGLAVSPAQKAIRYVTSGTMARHLRWANRAWKLDRWLGRGPVRRWVRARLRTGGFLVGRVASEAWAAQMLARTGLRHLVLLGARTGIAAVERVRESPLAQRAVGLARRGGGLVVAGAGVVAEGAVDAYDGVQDGLVVVFEAVFD